MVLAATVVGVELRSNNRFSDLPDRRGPAYLRSVDGQAATTGSGSSLAIDPNHPLSRDVHIGVQPSGPRTHHR